MAAARKAEEEARAAAEAAAEEARKAMELAQEKAKLVEAFEAEIGAAEPTAEAN
jgi:hypothetical protein